jgi:GrpB-like predicted nucleotidyltransferase (UPF0157 family)
LASWHISAVAKGKIEPYSDAWPRDFARIAKLLRSTLDDRALRIDHVGSTSVPQLDAKDTVDIQVTLADLDDAQPMLKAGFQEFLVRALRAALPRLPAYASAGRGCVRGTEGCRGLGGDRRVGSRS